MKSYWRTLEEISERRSGGESVHPYRYKSSSKSFL